MPANPEDSPQPPASREALRREADREIVGLLRRNHEDNRQIIALLGEMVALLREASPLGMACDDTGFHVAID